MKALDILPMSSVEAVITGSKMATVAGPLEAGCFNSNIPTNRNGSKPENEPCPIEASCWDLLGIIYT